jgi:hypothetical protein
MELWCWATPFTHTPQAHNKALFTVADIYYMITVIQIHGLSAAVDDYTLHLKFIAVFELKKTVCKVSKTNYNFQECRFCVRTVFELDAECSAG